MFSQSKKVKIATDSNNQNRIAAGTLIIGDISGKGCFRIEGTLKGSLKTPGKVVIGEGGFIEGNLECENADVEGKILGNTKVTNVLTLRGTAKVEGEVIAGSLSIEPGANFNATCQTNQGVKSLNDERTKTERRKEKSA
ncbi:polymer-forming cytoskeletal protein [Gramella sp. AN32]|uniref:Polymer-forming cytoskeletal protein n=1 Tax=Christiangramia antarctica TaxID=2058158 RepID=A0ABW5WYX1_9FLAO|nr:polymer-forming cytoskeletal protein [Gramella sp. AN32]MCM4155031.1 hypothetical protein [Gramella sp. AN32]